MKYKTYGFKIGKHIIDIKSKDEQSAFILLGKKCWDFISNNEKVELLGELKPYIAGKKATVFFVDESTRPTESEGENAI